MIQGIIGCEVSDLVLRFEEVWSSQEDREGVSVISFLLFYKEKYREQVDSEFIGLAPQKFWTMGPSTFYNS